MRDFNPAVLVFSLGLLVILEVVGIATEIINTEQEFFLASIPAVLTTILSLYWYGKSKE